MLLHGKTDVLGDTCTSAALYTTNLTWTDLESNSDPRGERTTINRLSHGRPIKTKFYSNFFSSMAHKPLVGQDLLVIEVSRSHTLDTPHSVGLLWTSDQPDAETST
jgi:hypothetical protein